MTVHVVTAAPTDSWPALIDVIRTGLAAQFDIHHTTVQVENTPCGQSGLRLDY